MRREILRLVEQLELIPHPEGGYYKETYRSEHNHSTAIYFLLTSDTFSALHRIKHDELWHFYQGSPLYVHEIDKNGNYTRNVVGVDHPQLVVKGGTWFGASVVEADSYSLVGCTVAPAFEFKDFELAKRDRLTSMYPQHEELIARLTRN